MPSTPDRRPPQPWRTFGAMVVAGAVVVAVLTVLFSSGGGGDQPRVTGGLAAASPPRTATTPLDRGTAPVPRVTRLESISVGGAPGGAEIVRPAGLRTRLPGVIFLHGWGLVARSVYRPWVRHLAKLGNEVIVPRYQLNKYSVPARALPDALTGIRAALRRAPVAQGTLVVAGHSAGAALASDYAASAPALGLPRPLAVFAAYPGRRILGYPGGIPQVDPARIPARTRVLAMAGANDVVVAQAPARELIAAATRVPRTRKRYVLVRDPAVDDHYGPTRSGPHARAAFWKPLDRLIARARARR